MSAAKAAAKTAARKAAAQKIVVRKSAAKKPAAIVLENQDTSIRKSQRLILIPQIELDGSSKWTSVQKKEFLKYLEMTANISAAARAIGKKAAAATRLRERDKKFASAWDEAIQTAVDTIEQIVMDRVANGMERPLGFQGRVYAVAKRYSDQLAMFYLRAKRPETFGKADGASDASVDNQSTPEMLEQKFVEIRNRKAQTKSTSHDNTI
jgi:hypothetical protein